MNYIEHLKVKKYLTMKSNIIMFPAKQHYVPSKQHYAKQHYVPSKHYVPS